MALSDEGRAGRSLSWLVPLLVLVLPVRLPLSVLGHSANLLLPLYLVIAGMAACAVAEARRCRRAGEPAFSRGLPDYAVLAVVGIAFLSLLWSTDRGEGLKETFLFYGPFATLYFSWRVLAPGKEAFRAGLAVLYLQAIALSGVAFWQYLSGRLFWNMLLIKTNEIANVFRVNSIFWDPNMFARYLMLVILFGLHALAVRALLPGESAAAPRATRLERMAASAWLPTLAVIVSWSALVITFSRSASLSLVVAMTALAGGLLREGSRKLIGRKAVMGVMVAVMLALALLSGWGLQSSAVREALSQRYELIIGGLQAFRESPIVGKGVGSYKLELRAQAEFQHKKTVASHNTLVSVLTETGLYGLTAYLFLLAAFFFAALGRGRGASLSALAGFAAIVLQSMLYGAFFEDPYLWWLMAVIATNATAGERKAADG